MLQGLVLARKDLEVIVAEAAFAVSCSSFELHSEYRVEVRGGEGFEYM